VKADYKVYGNGGALSTHWQFPDGAELTLLANLGAQAVGGITVPNAQMIYSSAEVDAATLQEGTLPPWSVAWFLES